MLRLPPYAPELNPIENVWEYLRGNYLGHIEQIVEACCTAWNAFIHDTENLRHHKIVGKGHHLRLLV